MAALRAELARIKTRVWGMGAGVSVRLVETLAPPELPAVAALARGQAELFRVEAAKARAAAPDASKRHSGGRLTARGGQVHARIGNGDGDSHN